MQLIQDITQWHAFRKACSTSQSIGFVPTMGALHKGHVSLMTASLQENDLTIASLFVNPTQFNNPTDFTHYPRTFTTDLDILTKTGVDVCLAPDSRAIYSDDYRFQILENAFSQQMEGRHRPGHFNGVLTVVMKLLNLIRPTRAYFGEKDYQQFQLIHDMADAFFMDIDIKACPTIREPSGLAYSSRNQRLTPKQLETAVQFAQIFHQSVPINTILSELHTLDITVDYVEEHLKRRFAAVNIGEIRLIDNYPISSVPSTT